MLFITLCHEVGRVSVILYVNKYVVLVCSNLSFKTKH